jgi:hypothetical protein
MFHTPKTFLKFGLKQKTTWFGIILVICFIYSFRQDFKYLISHVLRDPSLIGSIASGLGGSALVLFNRYKPKD